MKNILMLGQVGGQSIGFKLLMAPCKGQLYLKVYQTEKVKIWHKRCIFDTNKRAGIDIILAADHDRNNLLDYYEAANYLHLKTKIGNIFMDKPLSLHWFTTIDKNEDGFLSAEEIDPEEQFL